MPPALLRLARAAGGSIRDALSLLDQALAYVGSDPTSTRDLTPTMTSKQVEMLLGFLPDEFLVGFASALLERKPSGSSNGSNSWSKKDGTFLSSCAISANSFDKPWWNSWGKVKFRCAADGWPVGYARRDPAHDQSDGSVRGRDALE